MANQLNAQFGRNSRQENMNHTPLTVCSCEGKRGDIRLDQLARKDVADLNTYLAIEILITACDNDL